MLNIEKYKDEILKKWDETGSLNDSIIFSCVNHTQKNIHITKQIIEWLCSECEEQYLTLDEQKYLYCFLHPYFEDYEITIEKSYDDLDRKHEFIEIYLDSKAYPNYDIESILLPNFGTGTRYKGLENGKEYTLEELGIK